jgi:hypothetical protein
MDDEVIENGKWYGKRNFVNQVYEYLKIEMLKSQLPFIIYI